MDLGFEADQVLCNEPRNLQTLTIYYRKKRPPKRSLRLSRNLVLRETMLNKEVGYASEEFTSAFETRENTAKSNLIHGFQQWLEGDTPP